MIVYPNHNAAFIHIPKTAGSSITHALWMHTEYNKPPSLDDKDKGWQWPYHNGMGNMHATRRQMEAFFARNCAFKSFTFVRNPWDRMTSLYRRFAGADETFYEYVIRFLGQPDSIAPAMYRQSQTYWSTSCDYVCRFERLHDDFKMLCDTFGFDNVELPHRLKFEEVDWRMFYDDPILVDLVGQRWKEDIEQFSYTFEGDNYDG